jgi:hypothetical protein
VENLRLAGRDEPDYFAKGTAMHKLLEFYYFHQGHYRDSLAFAVENFQAWHNSETCEISLDMDNLVEVTKRFTQYGVKYGKDLIPLLNAAGEPAVEVGFSKVLYEDESKIFIGEGRIDLLATFEGTAAIVDHKTQAQKKQLYLFSPQFLTYSWATGIRKVLYNYIGFQKDDTKDQTALFRREYSQIPEHVIEQWRAEMMGIFNAVYMSQQRKEYAMNHFSCQPDRYPCPYTQLCESSPATREVIKRNSYVTVDAWRPW